MKTSEEQDECARIFAFAVEVLGSEANVTKWMTSKNIWSMGGNMPVELLMSHIGREHVESILGNIQNGGGI